MSGITSVRTGGEYDKQSLSKISTAADNPSGLAISERMKARESAYKTGTDNAKTGTDLLKTADKAMESISEDLQRIRELGVRASNTALYTAQDIADMQKEVDQLKHSIQDTAKGTEFNTQKLLDGSMADMNLATNPEGNGMTIQMENTTLETLGIEEFDLTKGFELGDVEAAMEKIAVGRESLAAHNSAVESTTNYTIDAAYNLESSRSSIEDMDIEDYVSDRAYEQALQAYRNFAQKEAIQQDGQADLMKKLLE